ncbi:thiamine ABC transporter ATP-binding protein [Aurantimonas endophytica]|uniref:Thiamine transport system ATP-binding protein n=1 Tax=Aurantimonas endophytica TaxID=1522175 RepID=A0A7W6HHT2_9HYPH|nr:thiamine ABC transporter ATP-binding protein [Aurantimonas endophytica]MBB4005504.1 thiamine transport system ATP-binding protein [Aurantimonas endophytica]MCO6406521.1 thiamine ABC transporter ATP-binding protein [Aurantimonas endophytica]
MSAAPALVLDGVRFSYEAMRMRLDLAVEAGEWLALIGPSGAGKSTLLDIAAGFAEPDAGRVLMAGADVTRRPPAERPLSILFQDNNLFTHLDVFRNVALGIAPGLRVSRADRARVAAALEAVGLAGFETRRPAEMSGGERQRVALARAFLRDRPLLLLDEPFAALGPALRQEMLALLQSLRAERKGGPAAVVMVTHHPEDAADHADRVAFLEAGEIVAVGPTRDVLTGQGEPRVAAYLGTAKTVP